MSDHTSLEKAITGSLLGTAVGDALGLPLEGLSPSRAAKLFGDISDDFSMRLLFGRGLVSDDTEHALLTLEAFAATHGETAKFERELARRLKIWFLCLPPGTGLATAKACLKLLLSISPKRAGVFSAGNGPAMRAPMLGVLTGGEEAQMRALVRASTRLTHTDPKAEIGALAIALAAFLASTPANISPRVFQSKLHSLLNNEVEESARDFLLLMERVVESVEGNESTPAFAAALGLERGVSGYIFHTVPVCLHAWLRHQNDLQQAMLAVLRCGGDADSTAAITGGIVGAHVGPDGIPPLWLNALIEWPRSTHWMAKAARQAAKGENTKEPFWFVPVTMARNGFLLSVVLLHGFRRLLPPY